MVCKKKTFQIAAPMSGVTNFLQTAIQIVTQATEADQAQKYDEAFRLYQLSLQYFQTALKCMFTGGAIL